MTTHKFRCTDMHIVLFDMALKPIFGSLQFLMTTKITPYIGAGVSREYLR